MATIRTTTAIPQVSKPHQSSTRLCGWDVSRRRVFTLFLLKSGPSPSSTTSSPSGLHSTATSWGESPEWDCRTTRWKLTAANSITFGMLGPLIYGLSLRDSSLVIIFFLLLSTIPPAYLATLGPKTGMRQMIQARYSFGYVSRVDLEIHY